MRALTRSLAVLAAAVPGAVAAESLAVPAAYRQVAAEYGVPHGLLFAIALTESGRGYGDDSLPWPWVLNVAGEPRWFTSRATAAAALRRLLAAGQRLVDVGLMQVNWRWHGELLRRPQRALDPWFNLRAGATVLVAEYRRAGDWWAAVGRYHAPGDAQRAAAYRERVRRWHGRLR